MIRAAREPRAPGLDATSRSLGKYLLRCQRGAELLFVDNETNPERWRGDGESNRGEPPFYFKDGINDYLVGGRERGGQPGAGRDQGGRALPARDPGRAGSSRCGCV